MAWHGKARQGFLSRGKKTELARRGGAWRGLAWRGTARQDKDYLSMDPGSADDHGGGNVYFVCHENAPDAIKIGAAGDVAKRKRDGTTWAPYGLRLLAVLPGDWEHELHDLFAKDRIKRKDNTWGEWFHATPELLGLIKEVESGNGLAALHRAEEASANERVNAESERRQRAAAAREAAAKQAEVERTCEQSPHQPKAGGMTEIKERLLEQYRKQDEAAYVERLSQRRGRPYSQKGV